jgi:hypothetical protein
MISVLAKAGRHTFTREQSNQKYGENMGQMIGQPGNQEINQCGNNSAFIEKTIYIAKFRIIPQGKRCRHMFRDKYICAFFKSALHLSVVQTSIRVAENEMVMTPKSRRFVGDMTKVGCPVLGVLGPLVMVVLCEVTKRPCRWYWLWDNCTTGKRCMAEE